MSYIKSGFQSINVEEKSVIPDNIRVTNLDVPQIYRAGLNPFRVGVKEQELANLIDLASITYIKDSLVKNAVDKFAESFADFEFSGNDSKDSQKAIDYLEARLDLISLYSGEYWKVTVSRFITEYFKTGNVPIMKVRGAKIQDSFRPFYTEKPYLLTSLVLCSPSEIKPVHNKNKQYVGWAWRNSMGKDDKMSSTLLIDGAYRLNPSLGKKTLKPNLDDMVNKDIFLLGQDISLIAYSRPGGSPWGVGPTLAAIEDVSLLRVLESQMAVMVRKYSIPLYHHTIARVGGYQSSQQKDLDNAQMLWNRASIEGFIVTPDSHKITAIGAESHALRVEGYLDHSIKRACGGLGHSTFGLGIDPGTLGSSQAFNDMKNSKIRKSQKDFSWNFSTEILWEILWEGGFDPWSNKDHRVWLGFTELNEDAVIKKENHETQKWINNMTTYDEMRKATGKPPVSDKGRHFSTYFPDNTDKPGGKSASSNSSLNQPINVEKFLALLDKLVPTKVSEVSAYLVLLDRYGVVITTEIQDTLVSLVNDKEAIIEYTNLLFYNADHGQTKIRK